MLCRAIAGFSRWQFPYTLTAERAKEQEQSDKEAIPFPKSVNIEMTREFLHDHMLWDGNGLIMNRISIGTLSMLFALKQQAWGELSIVVQ